MLNKSLPSRFGVDGTYWKLHSIEVNSARCLVVLQQFVDKNAADSGAEPLGTEGIQFGPGEMPIDITSNNVIAACRNAIRTKERFSGATDSD